MQPQTVDLIKYLAVALLPAAVGVVTLVLTNRSNQRRADAERVHQETLADAAARDARTERRYEERKAVYMRLIGQASGMRDTALRHEYEGDDKPGDFLDPPDLESYFEPLREALNEVLLVGTQETRKSAERIRSATEAFVWSWSNDHYRALDQALIDFRTAARADLGIEGGVPEQAAEKPPEPDRSNPEG